MPYKSKTLVVTLDLYTKYQPSIYDKTDVHDYFIHGQELILFKADNLLSKSIHHE